VIVPKITWSNSVSYVIACQTVPPPPNFNHSPVKPDFDSA